MVSNLVFDSVYENVRFFYEDELWWCMYLFNKINKYLKVNFFNMYIRYRKVSLY